MSNGAMSSYAAANNGQLGSSSSNLATSSNIPASAAASNISAAEIEAGITYLKENFMKNLIDTGNDLISCYSSVNSHLSSQDIDALISEQRNKLDAIQAEFNSILETARGNMQASKETVQTEQKTITESIQG